MSYNETMTTMIQKIRALTEDFPQSSIEVFTYETSNVFTLAEPRIIQVFSPLINGSALQSGQSSEFDSTTNKVTIVNEDFVSGDKIEIPYTFSQLSDSEIVEYIRASLVWLSLYSDSVTSYQLLNSGIISPVPSPKHLDLICIIASILIKPDYISYKTSNMSVTYPTKASKEEKITDLVKGFNSGIGVISIIEWEKEL